MLTEMVRAASNGPPLDPAATPEQVVLASERTQLRLEWSGGERAELGAERLRVACRCAWCTRAHIDEKFPASFDGIAIESIKPIGDYAINIAFTDGHARGIFPWSYLRTLALTPSVPSAIEHAQSLDGRTA